MKRTKSRQSGWQTCRPFRDLLCFFSLTLSFLFLLLSLSTLMSFFLSLASSFLSYLPLFHSYCLSFFQPHFIHFFLPWIFLIHAFPPSHHSIPLFFPSLHWSSLLSSLWSLSFLLLFSNSYLHLTTLSFLFFPLLSFSLYLAPSIKFPVTQWCRGYSSFPSLLPLPSFPITHAEILAHIQPLARPWLPFSAFAATLVVSSFRASFLPSNPRAI